MNVDPRRPSLADRRLLVDYLRGLRNEIAVDILAIEMAGLEPGRFGKIPRPTRWVGKAHRIAFVSKLVHLVSLPLWYFLGPVFFRRQRRELIHRPTNGPRTPFDPGGQILAFSPRAVDIIQPQHLESIPRQWLELPWLPLRKLPARAQVLPADSLLDESDLERAMYLAVLAHRVLQRRRGFAGWGLQSYTAWRWFFARLAVDELPGPLLTVDHFDRWAILVDGSVQHTYHRQPGRRLTIMQHGSVNAEARPRGLQMRLPSRLRAVSHLHVYSAADVSVFREQILSLRCAERGVAATFYRPSIRLVDIASCDSPSLLFVGHPLCETAHVSLMAALRQEREWQLFYKPHPVAPPGRTVANLPWTIMEGRSTFPRVDVIVSYPSTMVSEYAAHGIPAVVHRMDVSPDQILHCIPEILRASRYRRSGGSTELSVSSKPPQDR